MLVTHKELGKVNIPTSQSGRLTRIKGIVYSAQESIILVIRTN